MCQRIDSFSGEIRYILGSLVPVWTDCGHTTPGSMGIRGPCYRPIIALLCPCYMPIFDVGR